MDELKHLAKVRVAGSNPVFRSTVPVQRGFFKPCGLSRHRTRFGATLAPALAVASMRRQRRSPTWPLAPISAVDFFFKTSQYSPTTSMFAPARIAPGRLQPQIVVRKSATRLHASGGRAQ